MDFGLLYENDQGEYVVLHDVHMADIRLASLVYFALFTLAYIACLLHICVQINKFALLYLGPHPNNKYAKANRIHKSLFVLNISPII